MNACQLLFLLEAKQFEKPPFQGHVSICSKSGERNKTTKKQNKTKQKKSKKEKKITQISKAGFSSSSCWSSPGGYTHMQSPSAPPSTYTQEVRAPRLVSVYLNRQRDSHSLYGVPVLANKLERGIGC